MSPAGISSSQASAPRRYCSTITRRPSGTVATVQAHARPRTVYHGSSTAPREVSSRSASSTSQRSSTTRRAESTRQGRRSGIVELHLAREAHEALGLGLQAFPQLRIGERALGRERLVAVA